MHLIVSDPIRFVERLPIVTTLRFCWPIVSTSTRPCHGRCLSTCQAVTDRVLGVCTYRGEWQAG
jgi:hypothetical protein